MSYPCKLIQDLLPLYHDGVCSGESREIIEEHLTNCEACSQALKEIRGAESIVIPADQIRETQKADSLKKIKRKLLRKQIIITVTALFTTAAVMFGVWLYAFSGLQTVKTENISVHLIDGELVCRLRGGFPHGLHLKNIEVEPGKYYMFFTLYETKWDRLVMSNKEYREDVLAYKGSSNAQSTERVYYYQDDDFEDATSEIEMLPKDELDKITENFTLVWSK